MSAWLYGCVVQLMERSTVRVASYVVGTLVSSLLAFRFGTAHFDAVQCDDDVECDLAPIEGLLWAAGSLLLCLVAILLVERARRARR